MGKKKDEENVEEMALETHATKSEYGKLLLLLLFWRHFLFAVAGWVMVLPPIWVCRLPPCPCCYLQVAIFLLNLHAALMTFNIAFTLMKFEANMHSVSNSQEVTQFSLAELELDA